VGRLSGNRLVIGKQLIHKAIPVEENGIRSLYDSWFTATRRILLEVLFSGVSLLQLEELGEALLEFEVVEDLMNWLADHETQ